MPLREGPPQPPPPAGENKMSPVDSPIVYPPRKPAAARSFCERPRGRIVFIAGLASVFVLVLLLQLFA